MRAVVIERFGDPSGMAVHEVPDPVPAADQVVITSEAVGVGGVDAVIRRGTLSGYGFSEGLIPGSEVAGVVTAVGDGVDRSWLGRRVWAFTGTGGGYAEQAVARLDDVTALPDGLSSADAVTLGSAASVAHFALAHARFAAGESVLVRGAAGSIGIATVELAARGGAGLVAVTTSSEERGKRLRELGATAVLDRAGHGDQPGAGTFDVIIDIVGGGDIPAFIDRLAPNGRMVVVGAVALHASRGLRDAPHAVLPAVAVVRDVQPQHCSRSRAQRRPRRELRGRHDRPSSPRRGRGVAARSGRRGAPADGRRRRLRADRAHPLIECPEIFPIRIPEDGHPSIIAVPPQRVDRRVGTDERRRG